MRIQHNISAMNSYRNFSANNSKISKNLEKLSTGYAINRAGDDAAGLAISEKMRAQITGLEGATKNSKDGISLIQTAEGALTEVHDMLNRMTTLAEQSANGTYQNELDREQLQKEVDALKSEIDRIADSTNFNGLKLLDGSLSDKFETVTVKPSAISNIQTDDYAAQSVSSAFSASVRQIRPAAETAGQASFEVSLDDIRLAGGAATSAPSMAGGSSSATPGDGTADTLYTTKAYTAGVGENDTQSTITINYTPAGGSASSLSVSVDANADLNTVVTAINQKFASEGIDYASGGFKAEVSDDKILFTGKTNGTSAATITDFQFAAGTVKGDNVVSLKIGDAELTATFDADEGATATELASEFATAGYTLTGVTAGTSSTADYDAAYATAVAGGTSGNVIKIDGNYYEMQASGNKITFTQADKVTQAGETVNVDYAVYASLNEDGNGELSGTVNWRAQQTTKGNSGGSTQQAQASVNIDFNKLKDGDKLVAGDKTYVFKIGTSSTTSADSNKGEVLVNLSSIMKESSDLTDSAKQASAMDEIVRTMGTNSAAWSAGNGGVADDVGTLTFQSKSTYTDDNADIGGYDKNGKVNMSTEENVMKQFYATSAESAASVTFDFDASKIKVGDTFTIDGKTFEFTDGPKATKASNQAIDLHDLGVNGGLTSAHNDSVLKLMKEAIETKGNGVALQNGEARYNVSINGNKMTLTSKEDPATEAIFENRTAAKVELPSETTYGEGLVLQIGDTSDSFNKLTVSVEDMHSSALGIGDVDISTQEGASKALDAIKQAVNNVSDVRGTLGALQNRLDHTINNLGVMRENIQNAESNIRDTDVAEEMMDYTKNNILNQSAQAMLAQANQLPQGVLQLLG